MEGPLSITTFRTSLLSTLSCVFVVVSKLPAGLGYRSGLDEPPPHPKGKREGRSWGC
ncbi:hypothetical protein CCACVL1_17242 [Corchorus capsularis]|uniref:Uncharacterized protein n=1 Tax=Corchorus capsularis TaxID=210143 RepID=A0A1R3HSY3_COCAP|nr:hypothetical protein CCACVL1_17242 [Corchorus capsularis]